MTVKKPAHAVVIGGGIAGLSSTLVLAKSFEQVTLLEQDALPDDAGVRPHVPHGHHSHVLLAGGWVALSRLVPELPSWMDELGIRAGDLTQHTRVSYHGRWLPRATSGIPIRACTRGDVEALLRRKARSLANVRVQERAVVEELVASAGRVTGVKVAVDGSPTTLAADLVVDAMGRASHLPDWVERAVGPLKFEEQIVDTGVSYATAWYQPPAIGDDWAVLATLPALPDVPTMSIAVRYGDGRMMCSAVGYGKRRPPTSHDELASFMDGLDVPELAQLLRASTPLGDVRVFSNTKNRWRHYGGATGFPDGLVALGDSVCSLNPRYGQGMTVAALSVSVLEAYLAETTGRGRPFSSRTFQRRLDRSLTVPWHMALLEDRAWFSVFSGTRLSWWQRAAVWVAGRVLERAFTDIDTYIRFMRVAQLLKSPVTMLVPGLRAVLSPGARTVVPGEHAPGVAAVSITGRASA